MKEAPSKASGAWAKESYWRAPEACWAQRAARRGPAPELHCGRAGADYGDTCGSSLKRAHSFNITYSVVARVVEPELDDEARWPCGEAERRLEGVRDPREVGLRVLLEAAGVSDSYQVRVIVTRGDLSASTQE